MRVIRRLFANGVELIGITSVMIPSISVTLDLFVALTEVLIYTLMTMVNNDDLRLDIIRITNAGAHNCSSFSHIHWHNFQFTRNLCFQLWNTSIAFMLITMKWTIFCYAAGLAIGTITKLVCLMIAIERTPLTALTCVAWNTAIICFQLLSVTYAAAIIPSISLFCWPLCMISDEQPLHTLEQLIMFVIITLKRVVLMIVCMCHTRPDRCTAILLLLVLGIYICNTLAVKTVMSYIVYLWLIIIVSVLCVVPTVIFLIGVTFAGCCVITGITLSSCDTVEIAILDGLSQTKDYIKSRNNEHHVSDVDILRYFTVKMPPASYDVADNGHDGMTQSHQDPMPSDRDTDYLFSSKVIRFMCDYILLPTHRRIVGSVASGIQIANMSDLDMMFVPKCVTVNESALRYRDDIPCYLTIPTERLQGTARDLLCGNSRLVSAHVIKKFQPHLFGCSLFCLMPSELDECCTNVGLCLPLDWLRFKYANMDCVPQLKLNGLPRPVHAFSCRERNWPHNDVISSIISGEFHIVARPYPNNHNSEHDFCLSFAVAEVELSRAMYIWQRVIYLTLRNLKIFLDSSGDTLTSYHVRTVMFWFFEEADPDIWKTHHSDEIVMMVLRKLDACLESQHLPHYFVPGANLLVGIVAGKMDEVRTRIEEITSGDLLIDDVIADVNPDWAGDPRNIRWESIGQAGMRLVGVRCVTSNVSIIEMYRRWSTQ